MTRVNIHEHFNRFHGWVAPTSGPPVAGEADEEASEASGWEEREREERLAEMRVEAERWGEEE